MIKHMVFFKLRQTKNSTEEKQFFSAAAELASIDGVQNFERLKQINTKNNFDYGLAMQFETKAAYKLYSDHPLHTQFIRQYWLTFVVDFIEIDYVSLA